MRSKLVPLVSVASKYLQWVLIGGLALDGSTTFGDNILLQGIIMHGMETLFAFIRLPVEHGVSNRAATWLKNERIRLKQNMQALKMLLNGCSNIPRCCDRLPCFSIVFPIYLFNQALAIQSIVAQVGSIAFAKANSIGLQFF